MRPGEYLLLDTTRLDVFAMDPVTLRWVQCELTIAMDLYDRCVTGLRLTPVSTKAVDAAAVLFESVRPLPEPAARRADDRPPYHGLPSGVVIDAAQLATQDGEPLLPSVAAETIIVDHGRIYLSEHLMSACARLGISVQPARVYQATDKAALERFFRTLGEQLLAALPGYKGPDVYRRGKNPEQEAFYFLNELEQVIRRWTAECYHRQRHSGLCIPEVPGLEVSPLEMFAHGIARALPAGPGTGRPRPRLPGHRVAHHPALRGGDRRPALRRPGAERPTATRTSPYAGRHACRWPFRVDPGDVSSIWFQDPADNQWHEAPVGARRRRRRAVQQRGAGLRPSARGRRAPVPRHPPGTGGAAGAVGCRAGRQPRRAADGPAAVRAAALAWSRTLRPRPPARQKPVTVAAGGDDDSDSELDAPFPGEEPGGGPGDFYADAMETV